MPEDTPGSADADEARAPLTREERERAVAEANPGASHRGMKAKKNDPNKKRNKGKGR